MAVLKALEHASSQVQAKFPGIGILKQTVGRAGVDCGDKIYNLGAGPKNDRYRDGCVTRGVGMDVGEV